jgi:hypothetical protein
MSTKSQHIYSVNSTGGGSGGGVTTGSSTNAGSGNIIVNETVVVHHHHQTPLDLTCPETMSTTSGDDDDRVSHLIYLVCETQSQTIRFIWQLQ